MDEESKLALSLNKIQNYYTKIINTIGITGNIFSFIILIMIYLKRKSNTCILYNILCGLNIIYIFYKNMGLLNYKLYLPGQANIFTQYSLYFLIAWMQVLIGFHRFMFVVFKARAKFVTKKVFKLIFLY